MKNVSNSFKFFMEESGDAREAFMEAIMRISNASALDKKTGELAYIAVLAATGVLGGLPFHVKSAKLLGASRDEIRSRSLSGYACCWIKSY